MKNFDYIGYIIRLIIIATLTIGMGFILFCLPGCSKSEFQYNLGHDFELDTRLPMDENGYYHLQLGQDWQTLHRISGTAYVDGEPLESFPVHWESSHYWLIGDTLGYVVNQGLTDDLVYVSYDTTYVTWFEGFEVNTINGSSYSNGDGEINTMFAPVQSMLSDSVDIKLYYTKPFNKWI